MASFTDSEKVEYALKTTLNITMSKFGFAPFNETPAPPRVFPSNVMSKDLITYGEGDIDENGAYVSGHSQSGNIDTSLTTYESVLKYYKIVCPVTKRVSKAQLRNVLGTTSSQNILGRQIIDIDFGYSGNGDNSATESNFWTKPVNSNFHRKSFFRGHYIDESNVSNKFNYANTHYKGLNLAWNHIADGTDVSAAIDADGNGTDVTKIVPHLKLFLQVQTAFQIGADNKENQCFGHSMMKDMLGLDFKIPVQVNVGEVDSGDTVTASATSDITGPGVASGNEWYTQSTAGTINFYAVGHSGTKVDNSKDPTNFPLNSNAPLVTFLKYTGDHAGVSGLGGGGGGGGGGAAANPKQAVTNEPSWQSDYFGIGTTSPIGQLQVATTSGNLDAVFSAAANSDCRLVLQRNHGLNAGGSYNTIGDTFYIDWLIDNNSDNSSTGLKFTSKYREYIPPPSTGPYPLKTNDVMFLHYEGNVGIGRTDPTQVLDVKFPSATSGSDPLFIQATRSGLGNAGVGFRAGDGTWHAFWEHTHGNPDRMNFGMTRHPNQHEVYMTLTHEGRLGIGTTTPTSPLDVKLTGSAGRIAQFYSSAPGNNGISIGPPAQSDGDGYIEINGGNSSAHGKHVFIGCTRNGSDHYDSNIVFKTRHNEGSYTYTTAAERMRIQHDGNVGIGTTSPGYKLEVNGNFRTSSTSYFHGTSPNVAQYLHYEYWKGPTGTHGINDSDRHNVGSSHSYWVDQNDRVGSDNMYCSQFNQAAVYSRMGFMASSDRRIKKNIIDVPDDIALEKLRNIPCKYYDYIDKINGETTIGFIAQEVKEIFPIAVKITNDVIPSEMLVLNENNSNWEDCNDVSGNIYYRLIIPDLSNNKLDQIYAFYDLSDNKINARTEPNKFNSFAFTKKFDSLFCYGKEVNDFHTLDKQKLFALNFSATQELDRKVIALETKNSELETKNSELETKNSDLENEVTTLKSELAAIKQHLGI